MRRTATIVDQPDVPAIMALAIERATDGAYRFQGWQLAPRNDDDDHEDDDG